MARAFSEHSPLRVPLYRRLFAAQVVALAGTGISTVALALLAFEIEPTDAGQVLGTILALKMVMYVTVALAAPSLLARVSPRLSGKQWMVLLDLARVGFALGLPFATERWQIYLLIAALSACSAAFKPVYQATLPAILDDEESYTRALSLTRLAYDLENVLSPAAAALLLVWVDARLLFVTTALGFFVSAILITSCALPASGATQTRAPLRRAWRTFLRTPRLRGVVALNVGVAAAGAMMIVNGVAYVRGYLGLGESALAVAMFATGGGSMCVAVILPRVLLRFTDRQVMLWSAAVASVGLFVGCLGPTFWGLVALWFLLGAAIAAVQTPMGRLLNRSVQADERSGAFALQFSLSHACWLAAYGVAGWLPGAEGSFVAFGTLGAAALGSVVVAAWVWRADDDVPRAGPCGRVTGSSRCAER